MHRILAIAFTLSGFSALAYQVAWQRVLTQVIGSDAISVVLTVSIFMIWLGLGAELARRVLARVNRLRAGLIYAALEITVGLTGLISIPILRVTNAALAEVGSTSLTNDVLQNLALLAIPVLGMGMTTPFIVELAKQRIANLGQTVGHFYGLNILGAATGALLTGLVLIELFGLYGVTVLAAGLNFAAGLMTYAAIRKTGFDENLARETSVFSYSTAKPPLAKSPAHLSLVGPHLSAVLFGFGTLALQVVFFRILSNYFTLSVIVFPAVLCAYLLLMSAGQLVGGRLADRYAHRLLFVVASLFGVGAVLLLAALRFPPQWAATLGTIAFTSFNGQLVADRYPHLIGDPSPFVVLLFSMVFMLSVLAWAALFPVMLRLITRTIGEAGSRFASLYTFYTIGNVMGTLATGLFFFEWFGTGGTAAVTIVITGLGTLILAMGKVHTKRLAVVAAMLGIITLTGLLMPQDYYRSFTMDRYQIQDVFEGRTGVVTVVPTERFYTIIDMNRTASASAIKHDPAEGDGYEAWRWNHTAMMSLDPEFRPQTVLIIGIGHAYLIDALLDLPFIQKITIVELSPEINQAVQKYTLSSTSRIFNDPRVDIVIADGRRFVQKAIAQGKKYDLIQTKINEPWHAGSGNLFTVEFFQSQKKLLTPGGYLSLRPLAGHVVDGLEVFDMAVWPGYYHLFFKNGHFEIPEKAHVTPEIKDAWYSAIPDKPEATSDRKDHLEVVTFYRGDSFGEGIQHNTDDRPSFEYDWLARTLGHWVSPRTNLWYMELETQQLPVAIQD